MPWGALAAGIAATGQTIASEQAAGAAKDAAKGQQQAANLSYADQMALMRQQRTDSLPYRESGYNALNQLNYLMGLGGQPQALAKTQDNFDPEKYKNWLIEQMSAKVKAAYKDPAKQQKIIDKKAAAINAKYSDPTSAWANYVKSVKAAPNKTTGDYWKTRDVSGDSAGANGEGFGFLQQRFNNDVFEKDPGYQFRMDEGNKAVEAGAAARNGLLSGAAMKAMQKYSQGFASNEYGNAYNRFTGDQQNMYNRLAQMAGTGQQQINQTAQMNQQGASNAAGYMQDAAAARASGIMGASNARQSGYQDIGNTLMDTYGRGQANQKAKANQYGNASNGYGTAQDGLITDY